MKIKLSNYAWNVADKKKEYLEMDSIVELDSILMFIPKYALGRGYRVREEGAATPAGGREERGGLMNLYDKQWSGYAALPIGYIAVMKNGNFVPFTDFETPYSSDKWSVYDNLSLGDCEQWMDVNRDQVHIDHEVIDTITDSIDLEMKYYAMYQKPYTTDIVNLLNMGLSHIQGKINQLQDELLVLVKTDEPATQADAKQKTISYLANFKTVINITKSSVYQTTNGENINQITNPYIPGFVFDASCENDLMKDLQRVTGQSVSQGVDNLSLDGKDFSEVSFPAPYLIYNKAGDNVEYRAGNLFHNGYEFFEHISKRIKF